MTRTLKFKIYRYDPDKDDAPYMQDISVELEPTDRKLLDALTKLKPASSKGVYLKKVAVSSTMGLGVRVDVNSINIA